MSPHDPRRSARATFPALAARLTDLDFEIAELERIASIPPVVSTYLATLRAERQQLEVVYQAADEARRSAA